MANLVFILGDQLSLNMSSLQHFNKQKDFVLMAEVASEASYVLHHKKKLVFIFSAMRHFALELERQGFKVLYFKLEDGKKSFSEAINCAVKKLNPQKIIITEAGEWRVMQEVNSWKQKFDLPIEVKNDNRFIATHQDFAKFADGKKKLIMEFFYRNLRQKTGILVENKKPSIGKPVGGKWNFDAENRQTMPDKVLPPEILKFEPDQITQEVIKLVEEKFSKNFGEIMPFFYAVNQKQAQDFFADFIKNRLQNFGQYQDAMRSDLDFGFHSIISFYINVGLLDALKCCLAVEEEYKNGQCNINSAEGFVRQILGWREYIRGIYWYFMPKYKELNYFQAKRNLPQFYWDETKTQMNCIKNTVRQTRQNGYSHHIQRLMITGNFAMLSSIDPKQINDWYMAVYLDAFEWVELPNTHGMAIYADGGIVGSKPYAASGKYVSKMSNFCKSCVYDVSKTTGKNACPFNFLYWNFLITNQEQLKGNHRMVYPYLNLSRKSEEELREIKNQAQEFLDSF